MGLFVKVGEPTAQSLILQKLSEQTRFPRGKKLEFYRELLNGTPSLKVLSKTCKIVDGESHIGLTILAKKEYLEWVDVQYRELIISNCTESIRTNQNDSPSYMYRAVAYEGETNFDEALKDHKISIAISPTNSDALNAYAWFLSVCQNDSFRDGKQAVELATKACELTNWKQWNCIGTLAAAYAEAGDFKQAIKYEKQAISTGGITDKEIENEKNRIKLFEQNKPTHEALNWPE
jgi:tetratricopeptide (TPR) repeat protein